MIAIIAQGAPSPAAIPITVLGGRADASWAMSLASKTHVFRAGQVLLGPAGKSADRRPLFEVLSISLTSI